MATYKVPQFIEVEDKIFGPLTFKQFLYLIGGAGACFVIWTFVPHIIAFFLVIPVAAFSVALAWYKINNRPFVVVVEAYVKYILAGRLYLWHKDGPKPSTEVKPRVPRQTPSLGLPQVSGSKLKDLSWNLDVNENLNRNNNQ